MMTNIDWAVILEKDLEQLTDWDFPPKLTRQGEKVYVSFFPLKGKKSKSIKKIRDLLLTSQWKDAGDPGEEPRFLIDTKELIIYSRETKNQEEMRKSQDNYLSALSACWRESKVSLGNTMSEVKRSQAIYHAENLIKLTYDEKVYPYPIPDNPTRFYLVRSRKGDGVIIGEYDTFEEAEEERKLFHAKAMKAKKSSPRYWDFYQVQLGLVPSDRKALEEREVIIRRRK